MDLLMTAIAPLLPLPRVLELTSLSKPSVYRGMRSGNFPSCIKISSRRVAWRLEDIRAWLDKAAASRA